MLPCAACSKSLSSRPIPITTAWPRLWSSYVNAMGIGTVWVNWQECPRTASMRGSSPRTHQWWSTWKTNHIPPSWTCWGHCWSKLRTMQWHALVTPSQRLLNQTLCQSWQSATTDNPRPTSRMMGIQSALLSSAPNWQGGTWGGCHLPHFLWGWWPPRNLGTMMGSWLGSGRLAISANTAMAGVSTARRRVIIGINARSPSPQSCRSWRTNRIKSMITYKGGTGAKWGCAPALLAGANPAPPQAAGGSSPVDSPSTGNSPYKYWNKNALSRWLGPENLGWAFLDGMWTRVLVNNGARVNSVTRGYVRKHNLGVRPISDLDHSLNPFRDGIPLVGLGGHQMEPIGFTLVHVQIEGMPHYDEQQVAFVLDDPSRFSTRIPIILGTPTINRVIQTVKELDIHGTPMEWQAARVAYEWTQGFQFHRAGLSERLNYLTNTALDPTDLDEKVLLTNKCIIPGFQSVVVHGQMQSTMMMGHYLNVMTQAPYPDDKADLCNGLYVMRTYTELKGQ